MDTTGKLGFVFGAAACLGRLAWLSRNASSFAKKPPNALIHGGKSVPFGVVEGENRGENPMDPPKMVYDPLYWLRDDDRKDPKVINHLKKENSYTQGKTTHLKGLQEEIYKDFLSHIKETDESTPYPYGPYEYYSRSMKGSAYKIYCRRKKGTDEEQILLDMNEIAKGHAHCDLGCLVPSPDHNILAYSLDLSGYETYDIFFLDLKTKETVKEEGLPGCSGSVSWGKDNNTIFYCILDKAHKPYKLMKHIMGSDASSDQLLYHEKEETFWLGFGKTLSGRYLLAHAGTSETSEIRFLDLEGTSSEMTIFQERTDGLRYSIDHHPHGDYFYIVTNANDAMNGKIMRVSLKGNDTSKSKWEEVIAYNEAVTIEDLTCFEKSIVVEGREGGFSCIWMLDPKAKKFKLEKVTGFPEPVSTVGTSINKEFKTDVVRITYESLVTPLTWMNINFDTKEKTTIRVKPVPNYDPSLYKSEQIFATSHDGMKVPISLVYKRGSVTDQSPRKPGPLFLDAYGSYGISNEPDFHNGNFIPLLDRGLCVAVAHVRGGGELGRSWYEKEAKYLKKKNTFYDFIACAEHLVKNNYTTSNQVAIHGRSAGGLLIFGSLNLAPKGLFAGACIAAVPFVDVITTMSDPSIPLTTGEWSEWGNPNEEKYFDYMASYCPYHNVSNRDYPSMLVLGGLYDPRVAYWEPAKIVQRLRERANADVLLKIDLESGHFSQSDRYKYYREKAFEYAFVLDTLQRKKKN